MGIYEELVARGLIAQVTNEEEIREMVNAGKANFYIGFDCTADSLTAGHFMALTLMKRLQMAGNKPIALIGGGTTMIGDPSRRTDMRKMLTKEDINHNAECLPITVSALKSRWSALLSLARARLRWLTMPIGSLTLTMLTFSVRLVLASALTRCFLLNAISSVWKRVLASLSSTI